MALLNRFSKLNDKGETGIFTFIVTKSVTRDFHRDATTKDFFFGYHRWAVSFQRPNEKLLGVHLLLRNPSANASCVVDFSLALINREHFSQNKVFGKKSAKFTITNPMQGVSRWIDVAELGERRFANETGEFLFELTLSNVTTVFECDIQLSAATLAHYQSLLRNSSSSSSSTTSSGSTNQLAVTTTPTPTPISTSPSSRSNKKAAQQQQQQSRPATADNLISLETNCFTFGAFDWSLTIVPLALPAGGAGSHRSLSPANGGGSGNSMSQQQPTEPVCRVYLNRLSGFDCLCRVRYRIVLGHQPPPPASATQTQASSEQPQPPSTTTAQSAEFADSRELDQISDANGRIRGYQFRNTNILRLISPAKASSATSVTAASASGSQLRGGTQRARSAGQTPAGAGLDLRVHIELYAANTISEAKARVQQRNTNSASIGAGAGADHHHPSLGLNLNSNNQNSAQQQQLANCCDRNKQAWCVEADTTGERLRLKLFFLDLASVPRNHVRYISWIGYVVRRDPRTGAQRESIPVLNAPHCNYYLQDGVDMGALMDTEIQVKSIYELSRGFLDGEQLTVHIEWVDSLLLFSHLYNSYDSLATIQRYQISRELGALQAEFARLTRDRRRCQSLGRHSAGAVVHSAPTAASLKALSPPSSALANDAAYAEDIDDYDDDNDYIDANDCDNALGIEATDHLRHQHHQHHRHHQQNKHYKQQHAGHSSADSSSACESAPGGGMGVATSMDVAEQLPGRRRFESAPAASMTTTALVQPMQQQHHKHQHNLHHSRHNHGGHHHQQPPHPELLVPQLQQPQILQLVPMQVPPPVLPVVRRAPDPLHAHFELEPHAAALEALFLADEEADAAVVGSYVIPCFQTQAQPAALPQSQPQQTFFADQQSLPVPLESMQALQQSLYQHHQQPQAYAQPTAAGRQLPDYADVASRQRRIFGDL